MAKKTKYDVAAVLRWGLWGGLVVLLGSIVFKAMQQKGAAQITDIVVDIMPLESGNYLIDSTDIPVLLEERFAHPLVTFSVGELNIERLEKVIEEEPFVKSAEAFVDAHNRIRIEIEQREPLLRVMDNNGLDYYLDKDGMKMPPSQHYAAHVRIISGNLPPYEEGLFQKEKHLLKQVFELNQLLRADPFLDALVEQIYVNKRDELTMSPKVGKQTILFGRCHKEASKLKRLKDFYREGLAYKGWQMYRSFDLRYDGQVVCTKR